MKSFFIGLATLMSISAHASIELISAVASGNFLQVEKVFIEDPNVNPNFQAYRDYTPLITATNENCNLEIVKFLITKGADVNFYAGTSGLSPRNTALLAAVVVEHEACASYLIEVGANVNVQSYGIDLWPNTLMTPLHYAVDWGNLNIVKKLIDKGADIEMKQSNGQTALVRAVTYDKYDIAKYLIQIGANLEVSCKYPYVNNMIGTPLHFALWNNNFIGAKLLLDAGANINSNKYYSALRKAAGDGDLEKVKLLVKWGADVKQVESYGKTALIDAAGNGHTHIVKYLVDQGADINFYGNKFTAFHNASKKETYLALYEAGAKIDYNENAGLYTPLASELMKNSTITEKAIWLKRKGVNLNPHVDNYKNSVLTYKASDSAQYNKYFETLINFGVDINYKNVDGNTALMLSAKKGDLEKVKILLANSANVNLINNNGMTAYDLARSNGHREVARLIKAQY